MSLASPLAISAGRPSMLRNGSSATTARIRSGMSGTGATCPPRRKVSKSPRPVTLPVRWVQKAVSAFEQEGANAWYERPVEDFLPAGFTCPKCGDTHFEKEMNILDVWFDSGSSHEAVLSVRPELTWPSDLYLEGTDQHRGWFQSSLLLGLGTRGHAPYRQVVTNGFLLDTDGQKMSKSLGNALMPQDVIKQSGADILRLWVAMSDYQEETRVSKEILARVAEAYRKIRNTLRFLQSNLYDFDPVRDRVDRAQLEEVDRYILARYADVSRRILKAYDEYDYSTIFQTVNAFMTVDLSAFYADVSKDRLYTFAAGSKERRSAQTAMYIMVDGLARLLAPILSFSADELWRYLPGKREASVHLALFPAKADLELLRDPELVARWERLIKVRDRVLAEIEPLRKDKQIGSSLQARVVLSGGGDEMALLKAHADELPMLFIVSEVELRPAIGDGLQVTIEKARGVKCERCWRYVPKVSSDPDRPGTESHPRQPRMGPGICERCQDALAEAVSS